MAKVGKLKLIYGDEATQEMKPVKKKRRNPMQGTEIITYAIMAVNVIIFILMEFNGGSTNVYTLIEFGAAQRDLILSGNQYYRLLTPVFLHIGFTHLLFNSFSLYIFGTRVERYFGKVCFLVIYILSGIAGNLAMVLTSRDVCAGASGAIFGLIGATLALTQISKEPVDGWNFQSIIAMIVMNVILGIVTPNIGNAAHIGGLAAGYGLGMLIIKIKLKRSRFRI